MFSRPLLWDNGPYRVVRAGFRDELPPFPCAMTVCVSTFLYSIHFGKGEVGQWGEGIKEGVDSFHTERSTVPI